MNAANDSLFKKTLQSVCCEKSGLEKSSKSWKFIAATVLDGLEWILLDSQETEIYFLYFHIFRWKLEIYQRDSTFIRLYEFYGSKTPVF